MNQKELLKLGEQKLKSKKIEEAYYKAKIVLNYILNQTAEQFIAKRLRTGVWPHITQKRESRVREPSWERLNFWIVL